MSWPAARRPPSSEYLLADAQPAMRMPIAEIDDTASAEKMPTSRMVNAAQGPNGTTPYTSSTDATIRYGASLNSFSSASVGVMSSFWSDLPTSASSGS